VAITVHPDLRVAVAVPIGVPEAEVADHVRSRARWITRHLQRFERAHPVRPPLLYVAGEQHPYLGHPYHLDVEPGRRAVVLSEDRLLVTLPGAPSARGIEAALRAWYVARARTLFAERVALLHGGETPFSHIPVCLRVRWMRRRWGSCHPAGRVTLNAELVKTPLSCVDYVIVHELCHLLVPNHSPDFYRLLATRVPDWKQRKAEINGIRIF
jgi:hypothetical protein